MTRWRGKPVDFVTGFLDGQHARGRPLGVAFDPGKRILLIADDLSNTVCASPRAAREGRTPPHHKAVVSQAAAGSGRLAVPWRAR